MRAIFRLPTVGLPLLILTGCAEVPPGSTGPEAEPAEVRASETEEVIELTEADLERPRVDLDGWSDESTVVPLHLVTPEAASNIGTGSALVITIPDEGRFGCTANFVWEDGSTLYLGSAGHCFLPGARKATHGPGADYDASGVRVIVCIEDCEGNFRSNLLVGTWTELGRVAYARQTTEGGDEQVGHDFGVVEIPSELASLVRLTMPVWGGPDGTHPELESGEPGCHYGHGLVAGETVLTKGRAGLGGGSDHKFWMGDFLGSFGDSGSGLVACEADDLGLHGRGAVGVLTHLGLRVCPCKVRFKHLTLQAEQGVIFGTTVQRSQEMATEAGLNLSLVLP